MNWRGGTLDTKDSDVEGKHLLGGGLAKGLVQKGVTTAGGAECGNDLIMLDNQ